MDDLFKILFVFGPLILVVIGSLVIGGLFGRKWALAFALTTICLLAIEVYLGFRARDEYLAHRAWTASILAPLIYWLNGYYIVPGSFVLWMFGLGGARLLQRRRKRAAQTPKPK